MKQVNFRAHRVLALLLGLFLCMSTYAQTITVKGLVKDATGETVIGANVLEKEQPMVLSPISTVCSSCK